ncbi:MAG: hypothetical protein NZ740_04920 [Kiritimatiellae bacterium]|nr:hypothetical protein [Kiritimatiellia bacterium]MDW8458434.1 hypothetical protein [Verrucomicrobiota bacterium]
MNTLKTLFASLLLTALVWAAISWPLPEYFGDAIPAGAMKRHNLDHQIVHMFPGDHLQFLYYMWLFSDFLAGQTPFFYNVYEFNTGDDAQRWRPGSYYVPYSLAFSIFYGLGNRAVAWNATCFLALWVACFFTWRLARRYTASDGIALTAALMPLLLPYMWIQLFGGSPAGLGMSFIPMLLYGLDIAVRESRSVGGWLAGLAILFAGTTDTHAIFFSVWITPCWCLVAFTQRPGFAWRSFPEWRKLVLALVPVALLALVALAQTKLGTRHIQQTQAAGGRRIQEVALFSPKAEGLWSWQDLVVSSHIYFGYLATAVLALGVGVAIWTAFRKRDAESIRRAVLMVLIALGITGIILLALGPFSPWEGRFFTAARKFIPGYKMIRQPAKIYLLLPSLMAVGIAAVLQLGWDSFRQKFRWVIAAIAAGLAIEYYFQTKPLLSLVDHRNGAYASVAADAESRARKPRAIILPIWPGDSHYASVYQYYASLYRIRMINGYRPFVPQDYVRDVFERYRSLNLGHATDEQLDHLISRGIGYILLHEDMYPEKVAPFPVTTALQALLTHPRLELLEQDGPVWAFRILPTAEVRSITLPDWSIHFPARRIEAERQQPSTAPTENDPDASNKAFAILEADHRIDISPISTRHLPEMRWLIRCRGHGILRIDRLIGGSSIGSVDASVDWPAWRWIEVDAGQFEGAALISASLDAAEGRVDVDTLLLTAGSWKLLEPGESLTLPAPIFFHAGHIDVQSGSVVFIPERDRRGIVFYGPKLPLAPGHYEVRIESETDSNLSGIGGIWIAACPEGQEIGRAEMRQDPTTSFTVRVPSNQPFLLAFDYRGEGRVALRQIRLTRLE